MLLSPCMGAYPIHATCLFLLWQCNSIQCDYVTMHGSTTPPTLFAVGTWGDIVVAVIMAVLGTYSVVNQQPSSLYWPGREGASNACGDGLASLPCMGMAPRRRRWYVACAGCHRICDANDVPVAFVRKRSKKNFRVLCWETMDGYGMCRVF